MRILSIFKGRIRVINWNGVFLKYFKVIKSKQTLYEPSSGNMDWHLLSWYFPAEKEQ